MDQSANIHSIDSLRELRSAMVQFGGNAREAIVMLTLESRKAVQWLLHDRAHYWPEQTRKAQEWVVHARNDLERCQLHYGSDEAPSCFDQKKALEKAKRRLKLCEEKTKAVKKWAHAIREELEDFEGEMGKLSNWLEVDLPRAIAALERMLRALDKYAGDYQSLEPASLPTTTNASPTAESIAEKPPE
jgi:hypothetical protein